MPETFNSKAARARRRKLFPTCTPKHTILSFIWIPTSSPRKISPRSMFLAAVGCASKTSAQRSLSSPSTRICSGSTSPNTTRTKTLTAAVQRNSSISWSKFLLPAFNPLSHLPPNPPPAPVAPPAPPKSPRPALPRSLVVSVRQNWSVAPRTSRALFLLEGLPQELRSSLRAFAGMARQSQKREVQPSRANVLFDFISWEMLSNLRARRRNERVHGLRVVPRSLKNSLRHLHPVMQPFAELRDVLGGIVRESKVRQEQPLRLAIQNRGKRGIPDFQIDVRRRSGRHDEGVALYADARRVAHESDSFRILEIADVVRSVPWRVRHLDFARAEVNRFSAFQDAQILRGHRHRVAEELLQSVRPQPSRARQQLRGIDHMRRAQFVNVNCELRILLHQRAGRARVVQMNVRQQNRIEAGHRSAMRAQLLLQCVQRRAGAGIHDSAVAVRFQ